MSQCDPAGTASPAALLAVFTRQTPPSLPVRTSSASIEAGATKADNTAKKLRKAATRLHKGRVEGNDGRLNTTWIIETSSRAMSHSTVYLTVIIQAMPNAAPAPPAEHADQQAAAFIQRWQGNTASELSTAQSFVTQLCTLLDVPAPHPTPALDYMFERPITFAHGDGSSSAGRIDCYKHGHFVLEAKKTRLNPNAKGFTKGFDDALLRARAQGEGYARALPAHEGRPPFVLVVDVGTVIELYSEFTKSGATYVPFPDPRSHRIALADLAKPDIRQRLKLIWTDPLALDPSRVSASTTRDVAAQLAELAKSLEQSGHRADHVAAFLTRSLFSMFAEDVELLPKGSFLKLLQDHKADPHALQGMLRALWQDMDQGGQNGFSVALAAPILRL